MDRLGILNQAMQKVRGNQGLDEWTIDIPASAIYTVIFDHDFAKALWGDGKWQAHLQQMVLADDPIKYLGEHLDA